MLIFRGPNRPSICSLTTMTPTMRFMRLTHNKPSPSVIQRLRQMAVGLFLFFVLCGALHPSAAKAIPYDFTLAMNPSNCLYCTDGTLYFHYDGVQVTFDQTRFSDNTVTTSSPFVHTGTYSGFMSGGSNVLSLYDPVDFPSWKLFIETRTNGSLDTSNCEGFCLLFTEFGSGGVRDGIDRFYARTIPIPPEATVPEADTSLLLAIGLLGLASYQWRQLRHRRLQLG